MLFQPVRGEIIPSGPEVQNLGNIEIDRNAMESIKKSFMVDCLRNNSDNELILFQLRSHDLTVYDSPKKTAISFRLPFPFEPLISVDQESDEPLCYLVDSNNRVYSFNYKYNNLNMIFQHSKQITSIYAKNQFIYIGDICGTIFTPSKEFNVSTSDSYLTSLGLTSPKSILSLDIFEQYITGISVEGKIFVCDLVSSKILYTVCTNQKLTYSKIATGFDETDTYFTIAAAIGRKVNIYRLRDHGKIVLISSLSIWKALSLKIINHDLYICSMTENPYSDGQISQIIVFKDSTIPAGIWSIDSDLEIVSNAMNSKHHYRRSLKRLEVGFLNNESISIEDIDEIKKNAAMKLSPQSIHYFRGNVYFTAADAILYAMPITEDEAIIRGYVRDSPMHPFASIAQKVNLLIPDWIFVYLEDAAERNNLYEALPNAIKYLRQKTVSEISSIFNQNSVGTLEKLAPYFLSSINPSARSNTYKVDYTNPTPLHKAALLLDSLNKQRLALCVIIALISQPLTSMILSHLKESLIEITHEVATSAYYITLNTLVEVHVPHHITSESVFLLRKSIAKNRVFLLSLAKESLEYGHVDDFFALVNRFLSYNCDGMDDSFILNAREKLSFEDFVKFAHKCRPKQIESQFNYIFEGALERNNFELAFERIHTLDSSGHFIVSLNKLIKRMKETGQLQTLFQFPFGLTIQRFSDAFQRCSFDTLIVSYSYFMRFKDYTKACQCLFNYIYMQVQLTTLDKETIQNINSAAMLLKAATLTHLEKLYVRNPLTRLLVHIEDFERLFAIVQLFNIFESTMNLDSIETNKEKLFKEIEKNMTKFAANDINAIIQMPETVINKENQKMLYEAAQKAGKSMWRIKYKP